jgi:hypothetical protein
MLRSVTVASCTILLAVFRCAAQGTSPQIRNGPIASFSVGPDLTLNYPASLANLPDEHTTFLPRFPSNPNDPITYLVFASSRVGAGVNGAVVLKTTDLTNFTFASSLGYADQVFQAPVLFNQCDPAYNLEFDENYAGPGSVLRDPTLPEGNFMMIYEAENHCPGGTWQQPFYATIGFTRSSDAGKTWPAPVDAELGGPDRYPVLKGPNSEPASPESTPTYEGDAIPAAFVDSSNGTPYIYVVYNYYVGPGGPSDGLLRVARADDTGGSLTFSKWFNGSFSQSGLGGVDSPVLQACPSGVQMNGSISYIEALSIYLLTYVCNAATSNGTAAWYYSTATSLALQDWSAPTIIENSRFAVTTPCPSSHAGDDFDGFYPSFMSPGTDQGHLKLTGYVFYLKGCDVGTRIFASRTFAITTE